MEVGTFTPFLHLLRSRFRGAGVWDRPRSRFPPELRRGQEHVAGSHSSQHHHGSGPVLYIASEALGIKETDIDASTISSTMCEASSLSGVLNDTENAGIR